MTYTTTQLVNSAFYRAQIVSKEFETVSGPQGAEGVSLLNDLLALKTVDNGMIPYKSNETFTGVIGQEAYPIDDLVLIDTLVYYIDDVRYPMKQLGRDLYFGTGRTNNTNSLPYIYHVERNFGGATVYVYFTPVEAYTFEFWGTKRLASVTAAQDLELTLDRFYIVALTWELAEYICAEYGEPVPEQVQQELKKIRKYINKKSAVLDMRMRKLSTLQNQPTYNYAQVNLGRGWTPP